MNAQRRLQADGDVEHFLRHLSHIVESMQQQFGLAEADAGMPANDPQQAQQQEHQE